jgi:hypothetical protein
MRVRLGERSGTVEARVVHGSAGWQLTPRNGFHLTFSLLLVSAAGLTGRDISATVSRRWLLDHGGARADQP